MTNFEWIEGLINETEENVTRVDIHIKEIEDVLSRVE